MEDKLTKEEEISLQDILNKYAEAIENIQIQLIVINRRMLELEQPKLWKP